MEPELESIEFYEEQIARVKRLAHAVTSEQVRQDLIMVERQYETLILRAKAARLVGV